MTTLYCKYDEATNKYLPCVGHAPMIEQCLEGCGPKGPCDEDKAGMLYCQGSDTIALIDALVAGKNNQ